MSSFTVSIEKAVLVRALRKRCFQATTMKNGPICSHNVILILPHIYHNKKDKNIFYAWIAVLRNLLSLLLNTQLESVTFSLPEFQENTLRYFPCILNHNPITQKMKSVFNIELVR
jgi:hypothetical protein